MTIRALIPKLRSQKLALVLLVLLALMAVVGTPWPTDEAEQVVRERFGEGALGPARLVGLVDTYRSPLFVSLLILLAVNITLCTWHRLSLYRKSAARREGRPGRGLRVTLDGLMHLSVVIILLGGAAKGLFSTVGTQYLFAGVETDTVFDWDTEAEAPLGFTLLMRKRVEDYYPLAVRVGVSDAATGGKMALVEIWGRGPRSLPGEDLRLSVDGYDLEEKWIDLKAATGEQSDSFRLELVPGGKTSATFGRFGLTLVAWRRDLKSVRGLVAVLDGGRQVKEQWLSPNGRLGYKGTSVFLTAWGEDEYRNPYLGIQVVRDPGAVLFWVGATLLAVTLPLFIVIRHRRSA